MKEKKAAAHERKRLPREPYDVVLIVCEGEKTEPYYFESLREFLRLSSTNIQICGKECGSAPISVVEFALKEFKANKTRYNRVFCVFDRDKHVSYDRAIEKINTTKLPYGSTIKAITSEPCFEVWLLLHFEYSTRSYRAAGDSSNGVLVVKRLKDFIENYEKGSQKIFEIIGAKTEYAIQQAKKLAKHNDASGSTNPSTRVYELVEYLNSLK